MSHEDFNTTNEDTMVGGKNKNPRCIAPECGSRKDVWQGRVKKTSGGLTKDDLHLNDAGRIVSKKKFITASKEQRLRKHGYGPNRTFNNRHKFVKVAPRKSLKSRSPSWKKVQTKKRRPQKSEKKDLVKHKNYYKELEESSTMETKGGFNPKSPKSPKRKKVHKKASSATPKRK